HFLYNRARDWVDARRLDCGVAYQHAGRSIAAGPRPEPAAALRALQYAASSHPVQRHRCIPRAPGSVRPMWACARLALARGRIALDPGVRLSGGLVWECAAAEQSSLTFHTSTDSGLIAIIVLFVAAPAD